MARVSERIEDLKAYAKLERVLGGVDLTPFIAGHYMLDASDRFRYQAAERGQGPSQGGVTTAKASTNDR